MISPSFEGADRSSCGVVSLVRCGGIIVAPTIASPWHLRLNWERMAVDLRVSQTCHSVFRDVKSSFASNVNRVVINFFPSR